MSSRVVDGVAIPLPVAGHPALDFCNTRAGWNSDTPKEYLVDFAVLAIWCREFGLLSGLLTADAIAAAGRDPAAAQVMLSRGLALREALYPVCLGRGDRAQWARVAAEAEAARGCARLVPVGPAPGTAVDPAVAPAIGTARWQPEWSGLEAVVLTVADAAANLLTGRLAGFVGACPGAGCGWLFGDPRSRRRWCSMAVCGNRAKARRHRSAEWPTR